MRRSPTAQSLFYPLIIYKTSRFVKAMRRLCWRLTMQLYLPNALKITSKTPAHRCFGGWTHPKIGQCPRWTGVSARRYGLSPRLWQGSRARIGGFDPGMGTEAPAGPIRPGDRPGWAGRIFTTDEPARRGRAAATIPSTGRMQKSFNHGLHESHGLRIKCSSVCFCYSDP